MSYPSRAFLKRYAPQSLELFYPTTSHMNSSPTPNMIQYNDYTKTENADGSILFTPKPARSKSYEAIMACEDAEELGNLKLWRCGERRYVLNLAGVWYLVCREWGRASGVLVGAVTIGTSFDEVRAYAAENYTVEGL